MMSPRVEKLVALAVPFIALGTVATALRLGGSSRIEGARVYVGRPGVGYPGVALQLVTVTEEGGVPEIDKGVHVDVVATAHGEEARWQGVSNSEGVAEAWLDLPHSRADERLQVKVTSGAGAVLAEGAVDFAPAGDKSEGAAEALPAAHRAGDLKTDVYILGGRLVAGSTSTVLLHVEDTKTHAAVRRATVETTPEPGLIVQRAPPPTNEDGWTSAEVEPSFLVAGWTLTVHPPAGNEPASTWYGSLPISVGATHARLPFAIAADTPFPLTLDLPPASTPVYLEVDDADGRDFATPLEAGADNQAHATLPPLHAGLYWLVTSSSPRGVETMTGSTLARPFRATPSADEDPLVSSAKLVTRKPPHWTRHMALDGLALPRAHLVTQRRRALAIALGALVLAMMAEGVLIGRAASRSRARVRAVSKEAGVTMDVGLGLSSSATVLAFVTLLGLGLTAALLLLRGWG
jgi:hypothetical protein